MSAGDLFERLYVVHCRRLTARRRHTEGALCTLGWNAQWIETFDPDDIPRAVLRACRRAGRLTPGEVSVRLKHLEVWRDIQRGRCARAFVLEDDAVFPPGFAGRIADYARHLPSRFDLVFFGNSCGLTVPPDPVNPLFGRERGSRSMNGYLVTPRAAAVLLDALDRMPFTAPIDLALNRVVRERGLVVHWSVPALIENGTETGQFAHSLGVGWRTRAPVRRALAGLTRLVGWAR